MFHIEIILNSYFQFLDYAHFRVSLFSGFRPLLYPLPSFIYLSVIFCFGALYALLSYSYSMGLLFFDVFVFVGNVSSVFLFYSHSALNSIRMFTDVH